MRFRRKNRKGAARPERDLRDAHAKSWPRVVDRIITVLASCSL
jgi:hypothetical protein